MKGFLLDLQHLLLHQELTYCPLGLLQADLLQLLLNEGCLHMWTGRLRQQHKNTLDNNLWFEALNIG